MLTSTSSASSSDLRHTEDIEGVFARKRRESFAADWRLT